MRRAASTPPELPGYTFIKLLGSGGFSDVFLYEQKLPKRRVAVKVLLTEELSGANRAAFVAEANLMAQLSAHPYIVTIYQAEVAADDRPYFVMEYCSGPSLGERYKREKFTVADALRTGVRLSSAVATAHAAGILHRDIKPGNVLSNDYGWPALTDFGISSAVDDGIALHTASLSTALNDTGSGSTGASIGMSVPWSPPEMFEDDPQPDVRSDVFSLAATVYTILAGQTPFEVRGRSNGTLDLIGRIERGAITPMSRDDVPPTLLAVLQKGMATDRRDRFQTAVDFARALQRVEMEVGYNPTSIEVSNLDIAAPDRGLDEGGEDETRMRSVATIDAQPVAVAPPRALEPDESTVLRTPATVDAQPRPAAEDLPSATIIRPRTVAPAPEPEMPATPPASRSRRLIGWIAGVLAAVVAAAIVVAVLVSPPGGSDAQESPAPTSTPMVIAGVPTPELDSVTLDGSVVTFVVTNPTPEDDDVLVWRISNRTESEQLRVVEDKSFSVTDYTPGATVCVEVSVLRAGKTSANPLEECYPQ